MHFISRGKRFATQLLDALIGNAKAWVIPRILTRNGDLFEYVVVFIFAGLPSLGRLAGDSERDDYKASVRLWAILPRCKLSVNTRACLEERRKGKENGIASHQKPNNNFPQLITNQKWQIVAPDAAETSN